MKKIEKILLASYVIIAIAGFLCFIMAWLTPQAAPALNVIGTISFLVFVTPVIFLQFVLPAGIWFNIEHFKKHAVSLLLYYLIIFTLVDIWFVCGLNNLLRVIPGYDFCRSFGGIISPKISQQLMIYIFGFYFVLLITGLIVRLFRHFKHCKPRYPATTL
jgi:hypothetical protein